MERVVSIEEVRGALARPRLEGRTIGFVPTMGALHEGHLSLVRESLRRTDVTVVSVFVNPTQFGPGEDFDAYPRDLEADVALLEAEGVDVLFEPTVAVMYPPGAATVVDPGVLGEVLCGASRPGHFTGVATVVVKLLHIVGPDIAFFGDKDYQQLVVIRSVVRDLDIPSHVEGRPIVRERDGFALSSRNRYLSRPQRSAATVLYRALSVARDEAAAGESDAAVLERGMRRMVGAQAGVELEYATIVDAETLAPLTRLDRPARALVAARVGTARLIDNVTIPARVADAETDGER
jgi:pantoate--beta-alanine ligase